MEIALDELIQEIGQLEHQMQKYDWKYNINWLEFYKLVQSGKLEKSFYLHEWLGLIQLYLDRKELYQNLLNNSTC